jgi:two-component system sensor histidine kinase QseC
MSGLLHGSGIGSLRWRLLRWVTIAALLTWIGAALMSYNQARHDLQELMDGQMAMSASLLLAEVKHNGPHAPVFSVKPVKFRDIQSQHNNLALEFRIFSATGHILLHSANAQALPPADKPGYRNFRYQGQPWRDLVAESVDGAYRIQVAHSQELHDKEAFEIATNTVAPLGFLFPLMLALIYFSVRHGLKPLDTLAAEVSARSPDNLQRLATSKAPPEVMPLVASLNRLLDRLGIAIDNERRFTADAAHELRTPLAALKVQAQVAMASNDSESRQRALGQVVAGVDRTARLVEQLLRLARLDPIQQLPNLKPINLAELARNLVDEAQPVAKAKAQKLEYPSLDRPVSINGDPDLLRVALRNLIDNALRYTPEGGRIGVNIAQMHGMAIVEVNDSGPGVTEADLPKLVERFYRSSEANSEGSGLGLAIVQRIAEIHGARLEVVNIAGGGFSARLRWCTTN